MKSEKYIKFDGVVDKIGENSYIIKDMSHKKLIELFDNSILFYIIDNKDRDKYNESDGYRNIVQQYTQQALNGENILPQIELYTDNVLKNIENNMISIDTKLNMVHSSKDIIKFMALREMSRQNYNNTHKCTVKINIE